MALTFGGATTDRVAMTGHASFQDQTAFSILVWAFPTNVAAGKFLWSVGATGQKRLAVAATGTLDMVINRATTNAESISTTVVSTTEWSCVAATWDGTTAPLIYTGTRTVPLTEVSYSATKQAGTGTITSEAAGAMNWGNRVGSSGALIGAMARCQYFTATLSLAELQQVQYSVLRPASCVVYHELGYAGTGTQPDWSGTGNVGTVTGATVSAHAPLPPLFRGRAGVRIRVSAGTLVRQMLLHHGA